MYDTHKSNIIDEVLMNRKDILELRRRLKKESCTFTKMCGCYVNGEKKIQLEFRETFLNLSDDVFHKYLDISKKVLSANVGNNMLELNFPLDENFKNENQRFLMGLRESELKDDGLLRVFYDSIVESIDISGNYLILLFHDAYDVMVKTSDNIKMDDSEEVYKYILCAICPVSLSKPGLGYFEEESKIKARIRDWVVETPTVGFVYPGFIDRSSDVNTVMYYTKNTKDTHPELMETGLGCTTKQTATIQKETFQSIIKSTVSTDDAISDQIFTDIQENLNTMIEEHHDMYDDTDTEPITLSKDAVKSLLLDSGVSEEATAKIEASYDENFGEDLPLAEHLVDTKLIKANASKKKEAQLLKQVEDLEQKLDSASENTDSNDKLNIDVVLHVKPDKLPEIRTELINGRKCIIVPINDDEQATINGRKDLI